MSRKKYFPKKFKNVGLYSPLLKRYTLKINNKAIMEKDNIKYLGVIIDSQLNWKKHIPTVSKKISRCIGIMCKLGQFMNTNIYYSLLYSHLVYSIQVWGSACISEINKILVLQKSISARTFVPN